MTEAEEASQFLKTSDELLSMKESPAAMLGEIVNIKPGFMSAERKWFAVCTRARNEKKISERLTRNNIENYCPLNKIRRQSGDRKKAILEPLFPSFVFVRTTEEELMLLKKTEGVVNIVFWHGKPAVFPDYEILTVRRFLNDYENVKLEKTVVSMNDHVRVLTGPIMEQEGNVISVNYKTVRITLPTMGYMMAAEVEVKNVEVIPVIPTQVSESRQTLYAIK